VILYKEVRRAGLKVSHNAAKADGKMLLCLGSGERADLGGGRQRAERLRSQVTGANGQQKAQQPS
jgi:hypothetical protein